MTILEKVWNNFYAILSVIADFLPVALMITFLKAIINLQDKTNTNFKDILFEFGISIVLACIVGYFAHFYFSLDIKIVIGLVAVVSWTGSKFKTIIDNIVNNKIKNIDTDGK